jgi:hypothetical protein
MIFYHENITQKLYFFRIRKQISLSPEAKVTGRRRQSQELRELR